VYRAKYTSAGTYVAQLPHDRRIDSLSATVQRIQAALEKGGIQFIDENGGGAGVRLRKPPRQKR
jgi:hypothetical protein